MKTLSGLSVILVMLFASSVFAQGTGAANGLPPASTTTAPVRPAATQPIPASTTPANPSTQQPRATTTKPIPPIPAPASTSISSSTNATSVPPTVPTSPVPVSPLIPNPIVPENSGSSSWPLLWLLIAGGGALLPFGYLLSNMMKKRKTESEKKDDDDSQCFNLKQMMQNKLDELADIRGRIEGKVVQAGREGLRDSLQGTATGNAIAVLDTAEKEYNRIKKLYEQCMINCGCSTLQGTIAENSLAQTDILSKVLVEKTYMVNQAKIHDVIVKEKFLPELAQAMNDGPGYMHFWREGGDDVKVMFKNKTFDIKRSDASTWAEAESYGESLRKKNQLGFK